MASRQLSISRECTPVVDTRYESEDGETPAMAIVDALAMAEGVDATELPSLYEVIDTDALNSLFDGQDGEVVLSFAVGDWNVFVNADGQVRVCDTAQPTEPAPVFARFSD